MLDGTVVEVVALGGRGQAGRGGTGERADGGRACAVHLLVGETHPHRRLGLEELGEGQAVLPRDRLRQAHLHEHVPARGEPDQPVPGRGGDRTSSQLVAPGEPGEHVGQDARAVAAQREQDVVALDEHVDVVAELADLGVGRADVGRAGPRLLQHIPAGIGGQPRHVTGDQAPGQPAEVGQPVGDERDQVGRAPRVDPLEYRQRAAHLRLVGPGRCPFQRRGQENGVHRRHLELHVGAVILRRHREKARNIKLDVGRDDGGADAHRSEKKMAQPLRVRRAPRPARPPA